MSEIILKNDNGQILASSRDIAERFGKKHAEVIYAIEGRVGSNGKIKNNGLLMSGISQLSQMFKKSDYVDSSNRKQYEYLMNRDGFSLLVMGFTGKEALQWKLKYIEAFNKMEEEIKTGSYLSEENKLILTIVNSNNKETKALALSEYKEIITQPLLEDISKKEEVIEKQDKQLEIQKPFVKTAIKLQNTDNTVSFEKAAKLISDNGISIGRNTLMKELRNHNVLMDNNSPYERYRKIGLFKVKIAIKENHYGTKVIPVTRVTGKGLIFIDKKLREWFKIEDSKYDINLDSICNSNFQWNI